jgi:hypothetical protein
MMVSGGASSTTPPPVSTISTASIGEPGLEDTGVIADDREDLRADVPSGTHLTVSYVASHFKNKQLCPCTNPAVWARLYRYTYDPAVESYTLDVGFRSMSIRIKQKRWCWIRTVLAGCGLPTSLVTRTSIRSTIRCMLTPLPIRAMTPTGHTFSLGSFFPKRMSWLTISAYDCTSESGRGHVVE